MTDEVRDYAVGHGSWRPDEVVRQLRWETAALGEVAGMQIGDDQGQLLTMITRLVGARRAVEVGTFTGYSSLCIARGLVEGGSLLCCDIRADWAAIGMRAWNAPVYGIGSSYVLLRRCRRCPRRLTNPASIWCSSTPTSRAAATTGTRWCPGSAPAVARGIRS